MKKTRDLPSKAMNADFEAINSAMQNSDYVKAFSKLSQLTHLNIPEANLDLGILYLNELGTTQDIPKGMELLHKAADQDVPKAQFLLWSVYRGGIEGVPKDTKKALNFLNRAAQTDLEAQVTLAELYLNGKEGIHLNLEKALALLGEAAAKGDKLSQYGLFCVYWERRQWDLAKTALVQASLLKPEGNQYFLAAVHCSLGSVACMKANACQDEKTKTTLYREARINYEKSMVFLGEIDKKDPSPKDLFPSAKNFLPAVNQLGSVANRDLASMYAEGKGVKKDSAKALQLLMNAAEFGDADAALTLAAAYEHGEYRGEPCKKNIELAIRFYKMAADNGDAKAKSYLATVYFKLLRQGEKVVSPEEIASLYEQAIQAGDTQEMPYLHLSTLYADGVHFRKDFGKAKSYLFQAIEKGSVVAFFNMGVLHQRDNQIPEALYWYQRASQAGSTDLQPDLLKNIKAMVPRYHLLNPTPAQKKLITDHRGVILKDKEGQLEFTIPSSGLSKEANGGIREQLGFFRCKVAESDLVGKRGLLEASLDLLTLETIVENGVRKCLITGPTAFEGKVKALIDDTGTTEKLEAWMVENSPELGSLIFSRRAGLPESTRAQAATSTSKTVRSKP